MNEEEKKAIYKIEKLVKYLKDWNENFTIVPEDTKYFETILNMIDTYQRMINEQIEEILDYAKEEEKNTERINELINEVTLKQCELEKKDKIIDLMAEYISNITDCPFESEGKYLDCEKMCDVRTDKECWKQYFENKAKESGEIDEC